MTYEHSKNSAPTNQASTANWVGTYEPPHCRPESRMAGGWERNYWIPLTRSDANEMILAAKLYDRIHRKKGDRNGPLGHVGLELVELLANLAVSWEGKLFPTLEHLMGRLKRSRDAVVRALRKLRDVRLVDWIRRYELAEGDDGLQVRQTSNAYRLSLPKKLRALVKRAPPPPDFETARATRAEEIRRYDADHFTHSPLGAAFDRLGRNLGGGGVALGDHESARQAQPALKLNPKGSR